MFLKTKVSSRLVSLIFSILVICFAVSFYIFAWQEPSGGAAPEGNTNPPLHSGVSGQSKIGGLTLNVSGDSTIDALIIHSGYFKIEDGSVPDPGDCDSTDPTNENRGRMILDAPDYRLYICNGFGRGWDYIEIPNN